MGVTYTCLLQQHALYNDPGFTQMDDIIGVVTATNTKASALTFYHQVLWQTSKPIMPDDQLNIWVTYKGWDATNNTQGTGDLNKGAHLLFHTGVKTPTS
jgi:hypothetical protein